MPVNCIRYPSLIYKTRGKWQIAAVSQIHSHRVHRVHCVLNVFFSWRSLSLSMSHWLTLSYSSWCSWTVQWWREWYIFHCHNNLFCWTSLHWKSWTQQGNCGNLPPRGSLLLCNRFACWSLLFSCISCCRIVSANETLTGSDSFSWRKHLVHNVLYVLYEPVFVKQRQFVIYP